MEARKLSDIQIQIRIVPRRVRWPAPRSSPAWTKAHACVHELDDLVRNVDFSCGQAEQNEGSAGAIRGRRSEICDQALRKLVDFRSFEIAEKALIDNVDALERLSDRDPEQVQMLQNLKEGLRDLKEGIGATKRMILERCKVQQGIAV